MMVVHWNRNPNDTPKRSSLLSFRLRNPCPLILASNVKRFTININMIVSSSKQRTFKFVYILLVVSSYQAGMAS